MIKSIDTFYNGNYFRSRLEARWAVYFDFLHIKYQYEPEGYVLENGLCYLPDFYLPDHKVYVEVKPEGYMQQDLIKHVSFVKGIKKSLVVCVGPPLPLDQIIYHFIDGEYRKYHGGREIEITEGTIMPDCKYHPIHWCSGGSEFLDSNYMDMANASKFATMKRFEHK